MAQLADHTDIDTVKAAAKAIKYLDLVSFRRPTTNKIRHEDHILWTEARNNLCRIIESSGHELDCDSYRVVKKNGK